MTNPLKIAHLLIVFVCLSLFSASLCYAAPKVQVDQVVFDAGTIFEGKDITHEFVLKNVGDQKLIFKPKPC